ncbi:MAG: D-sedoheptulose 7-phosphate isomerase [Rhizobiaceae bacterium]|nr:D-sedoheptulose 7-phosphate isomerase [Rhizobiaceae bacterium]
MTDSAFVRQFVIEHQEVLETTFAQVADAVAAAGDAIGEAIGHGGTLFLCGNGGSAADAQHIAAEFVGRFKRNRRPLRALALTTDSSALTCIANDFNYDEVFVRQVEAFAAPGDYLLAISTSGCSPNVKKAIDAAHEKGAKVVGLFGKGGGDCAALVDIAITVPSNTTARIQEMHILIGHILCEIVEERLGFA